jgi:transforming growth factor-beta-induced protein
MKRFMFMLIAISLSLMVSLPVSAQDEGSTIADLLANDANYSLLLQAVNIADPIVLETLNGSDEITLFAPTNQAFRNLASYFGTSLDTLLADPEVVTELLLYHISPQALTTAQVSAYDGGALETLSEARVRINVVSGVIRLNDVVRIISPMNQEASNGLIHTLSDMVFPFTVQPQLEALSGQQIVFQQPEPIVTPMPPIAVDGERLTVTGEEDYPAEPQTEIITVAPFADRLTIAGRLVSDSRYSTLELILREVAPDYLDLLNNPATELTLFAPTNSAFTITLNQLGITLTDALENPAILRQIVAYHIVEGALPAQEIRALDGEQIGSILANGDIVESLTISTNGRRITLNGSAWISTPDRFATNGVIHTVDSVLLPASAIEALDALADS